MQLADEDEEVVAINAEPQAYFVSMGDHNAPSDVTHIRIDSSVRRIMPYAFNERFHLRIMILNEELEEIGRSAFVLCLSLGEIVIPNNIRSIGDDAFSSCAGLAAVTLGDGLEEIGAHAFADCSIGEIVIPDNVRAIKGGAFYQCHRLTRVTLGDGLEEIGREVFLSCTSLGEIVIPNNVRVINREAFYSCSGLTSVTLGDGLEEIGPGAFENCTSIEHILIPPAVRAIDDTAFKGCTNLSNVEFCPRIEEFVSCEAMRDWWNQGVHEQCLSTYCFLVRCSIPERLGVVQVRSWRSNIYDMLRRIPTIGAKGMKSFFASIDSRLSLYQDLKDSPSLLELVLWKSKIIDQFSPSDTLLTTAMKMQCRTDSIRMVNIIVPNVMTFLTDSDDRDCVIDDLSENEGEDEANDEDNNLSDEDDDVEVNDDPFDNFGNDNWIDEDDDNEDDGDHRDDGDFDADVDDQENDDDGNQVSELNDNEVKRRRIAG
jgi:hypothetical protein